jgi:hypothetical protein
MIDIDTFLASVSETRRRAQSATLAHTTLPINRCSIPPALDLILKRGGLIQPQLARSSYAQRTARVGVPCGDRRVVEQWHSSFGDDANYLLDLEASNMIAIEFSPYASPYWLFRRQGDYKTFERTLRFNAYKRIFALFTVPQGHRMGRGWYQGLHWRTSILIPPSRALWGSNDEFEFEFNYANPDAPLLPAPGTLLGSPVRPY